MLSMFYGDATVATDVYLCPAVRLPVAVPASQRNRRDEGQKNQTQHFLANRNHSQTFLL